MHPIEPQESWDKKKIFIFFLIVLPLAFFALKTYVLDKNIDLFSQKPNTSFKQVKGESSISQFNPADLQGSVEQKIDSIKSQVNNINVTDIATSTPQIQKVINDIKNLQNYPRNQAKDACIKICNGL